MSGIRAEILTLGELDFTSYEIPFYQRPYRWQTSNVDVLLKSLTENIVKSEYRIGSIIVNPDNKLNIVDGQQRLTTFSLLFMCLEGRDTIHKLKCKYEHIESKQNIYRNFWHIKEWLDTTAIDKEVMLGFLLNRCTVVQIMADNLADAFQMFDSQNGHGKELEAYNLLKAYHLRAIDSDTTTLTITEEKKNIDRQWEASALMPTVDSAESLLKSVINDLYRTRLWARQRDAWSFSRNKVREFKGLQFYENKARIPLSNLSLLLYLHNTDLEGVAFRSSEKRPNQNPFVSINMDIINGKIFFDYVATYVDAYKYVFVEPKTKFHPLHRFQQDFQNYSLYYKGAHRTGDSYIREVYMALILAMYDRFGEEYVGCYYKTLYILAYRERLSNKSVFYKGTVKFPKRYFDVIANSADASALDILNIYANEQIEWKMKSANEVAKFVCMSGGNIIRDGQKVTKEYFNA